MQRLIKTCGLCTVLLVGAAVAAPAWAQAAPDKAIEYRQQVYKTLGANLTAIALNLRQEVSFAENIPAHADALAAVIPLVAGATEQNTAGQGSAQTEAKPEIWDEWDEFVELAEDSEAAVMELANVADSGDMQAIGAQLQATAASCKACHDRFR
ncbi:MAG: c-type cytochrome, partial [Pseudomonadota bacterium]